MSENTDPQAGQAEAPGQTEREHAEAFRAAQEQYAAALKAAKDQHIAALKAAQDQQLEALDQLRQAASENAQYWEEVAKEHAMSVGDLSSGLGRTAPTAWVDAHFTYLEKVIRAQYDYALALVPDSSD